jgi:hypothetical protein
MLEPAAPEPAERPAQVAGGTAEEAVAPPAAPDAPPVHVSGEPDPAPAPVTGATPGVVRAHRDPGTGRGVLRVDETRLRQRGPVVFQLRRLCRYDTADALWLPVPSHEHPAAIRLEPSADGASRPREAVMTAPVEIALYWLSWTETAARDEAAQGRGSASSHEVFVTSGPVLCNDVDLGPAPAGMVPACVPFQDRAEARFVPSPVATCSARR